MCNKGQFPKIEMRNKGFKMKLRTLKRWLTQNMEGLRKVAKRKRWQRTSELKETSDSRLAGRQ